MDQVRLTIDDIVNKEFKKSLRGYDEEEVDLFLDTIIQDYDYFLKEIESLNNEIKRLEQKNDSEEARSNPQSTTVIQPNTVNYDILKRISNLEKAVFGPKVTEKNE